MSVFPHHFNTPLLRRRPIIHLGKTSVTDNCGGANGTKQQIRWDNALRADSGFDHSPLLNPSRIGCKFDGRVKIKANISCTQGGSARTTLMLYIRTNGSDENLRCVARNYSRGSSWGDISLNISTEIDVSNGDYIEIQTEVDDSDASYTINTINAQCEIIVERVE